MSKSCNDNEHIVHIYIRPTKEGLDVELKAHGCEAFLLHSLEAIIDQFHDINPVISLNAVEHYLDHALEECNTLKEDDND